MSQTFQQIDPTTVEVLLTAAPQGRFDHTAQRIRNDRAEQAKRADFAATLTAQGITVLDRPDHSQRGPVPLTRLTDPDGHRLTVEDHATCPGHGAYIGTEWRQVDNTTDDAAQVLTDDEDDDEDTEDYPDDEDDGEQGRTWQPPVQVLVAVFVCTDPQGNGHTDRWATTNGQEEKKRAADMTDDEREAARAERKHVVESNKAWKAATEVRRQWLATFAARKTAPTGAEPYLARVLAEGWGHESPDSDALTLAGFPPAEDGPAWNLAYTQRLAVAAALDTATPKRALHIALALAVAMCETRTNPNTWRQRDAQTVLALAALKTWGYSTAEVEDQMLAEAEKDPAADTE